MSSLTRLGLAAIGMAAICAGAQKPETQDRPAEPHAGDHPFCVVQALPQNMFTRVLPPVSFQLRTPTANSVTIDVTYGGFSAEAQAAFQYAIEIWQSQLTSTVPIRVNATFTTLAPGMLGSSYAAGQWRDFAGATFPTTWYAQALANKLHGSELDPGAIDVFASFNTSFTWYFGTDGNAPAGQYDFVSVALHELTHGLGFFGTMQVSGGTGRWGLGAGYESPGVYDRFVENGVAQALLDTTIFPNRSTALAEQLTGGSLYWNGPNGVSASAGIRPRMYAPTTWAPGSSYVHLDEATYPAGTINSLMTYAIGAAEAIHDPGPIVRGMFTDTGWTTSTGCWYRVEPTNATVGVAGGTGSVTVNANSGCAWTATSNDPGWLTVTDGSSGTGYGTVRYRVAANPSSAARVGALTIAGQRFTLTQAGSVPARVISLSGDLAFGDVPVNTTATRTLTISNNGSSVLTVIGLDYPAGFSGAWSGTVAAGASQNVTVTFAPTATIAYGGTVTVVADQTDGTNTIEASGTGVASPMGATTRVSVGSGGVEGNSNSWRPAISADGRWVAFYSAATTLVADDTNGAWDVFVYDRQTETTTRVSVGAGGAQANGPSAGPAISADGGTVAFWSAASNLVAEDTNAAWDVFVHDRQTGTTTRVSVGPGGSEANCCSAFLADSTPAISADGRWVAFESGASNLVTADTNAVPDVFVHDRQTGATTLASVGLGGAQANQASYYPALSADARWVAFRSAATNLVAGDSNATADVFVYDRQTGTISRASVGAGGAQANGWSDGPAISADGRWVAFQSAATNLVAGDTNGQWDVFLRDRQSATTTRVSVGPAGAQANGSTWRRPAIGADGRSVAFWSWASNLVTSDTNGTYDVFVRDLLVQTTTRVSVGPGGAQANGYSQDPTVSADGRWVAFGSVASNLVTDDTNTSLDAFVHDGGDTGCSYPLTASAAETPADGAAGSVFVLGQAGCAWTAVSNDPSWIAVTAGSSGTGFGTVSYAVAANTGAPRTGTVTIAEQTFTVTQQSALPTLALGPSALGFAAIGVAGTLTSPTGAQTVTVTQSGGPEVTWTARPNAPWILVSPASGTGNATFTVSIVDTGALPAVGTVTGTVVVDAPGAANTVALDVWLTLYAPDGTGRPIGQLDWLYGDTTVSGSIVIGGWVVDDIGVSRVEVYRDRVAGEPLQGVLPSNHPGYDKIYVATAEIVRTLPFGPDTALFIDGARPDIEALFPSYPWSYRAGWGYLMLTWGLPNQGTGTYTIYAFAFDGDGTYPTDYTLLGARTFTSDNRPSAAPKPFGAIDVPYPGQTVSGVTLTGGWGLTQPVPCQVTNVWVGIDAAPLAPVIFGDAKPGFESYFPPASFADSPNAGIAYFLDSTRLANGLHQISFLVQDGCGHEDGLGSRFFSALNRSSLAAGDATGRPVTALTAAPTDGAVTLTRGYVERSRSGWQVPERLSAGKKGVRVVRVRPLERIALEFPPPTGGGAGTWTGYHEVEGQLRPLPPGASLDADKGAFYWVPGPGFLGAYELLFVRTDAAGTAVKVPVRVEVTSAVR